VCSKCLKITKEEDKVEIQIVGGIVDVSPDFSIFVSKKKFDKVYYPIEIEDEEDMEDMEDLYDNLKTSFLDALKLKVEHMPIPQEILDLMKDKLYKNHDLRRRNKIERELFNLEIKYKKLRYDNFKIICEHFEKEELTKEEVADKIMKDTNDWFRQNL
jgi:hypothetical protein